MPSDGLAGLLVGPSQTTNLQSDSLETATADNLRDLLVEITEAPVGNIIGEENTADPTTNDLLDLLTKYILVLSTAETTNTDSLLYLLDPSAITTQNTVTATTTTAEASTEDLLADLLRSSKTVPTAPTQTSTDDGDRECCLLDDGCGENYESNRCRSSFCCDEGPTGQGRVCSDRVNESDCASDEELSLTENAAGTQTVAWMAMNLRSVWHPSAATK
ncbi:hypothetical protein SARC_11133 [Sphaeroforma arctica JP610]|uniref:Uncharacterized protein n=1 Tax=Sphaeroforma arctica JP610 TaxID=667725 RepID=A0A0L0FJY7_9EUKA|nr:hypothetical protein SARC_11133 [Sphaeroforma arctica JP610]KNC76363.1 hypothetical protein SARC_11133 [Sphaeroforma arctica JP610]|eukprot:XP_014150265.1 hypothetical protein SARC_11133 [Sphaeroforma arctica JP610]